MLSITTPGIWFGSAEETRRSGARIERIRRRRWSPIIRAASDCSPCSRCPTPTRCLKEIEYAFDTLKADGVGLMSSYGDKWHGDAAFAEVFRELNRRKAIVYTHAQVADCCQSLVTGINDTTIEYNTDTARTIISLIDSGRAAWKRRTSSTSVRTRAERSSRCRAVSWPGRPRGRTSRSRPIRNRGWGNCAGSTMTPQAPRIPSR